MGRAPVGPPSVMNLCLFDETWIREGCQEGLRSKYPGSEFGCGSPPLGWERIWHISQVSGSGKVGEWGDESPLGDSLNQS